MEFFRGNPDTSTKDLAHAKEWDRVKAKNKVNLLTDQGLIRISGSKPSGEPNHPLVHTYRAVTG